MLHVTFVEGMMGEKEFVGRANFVLWKKLWDIKHRLKNENWKGSVLVWWNVEVKWNLLTLDF